MAHELFCQGAMVVYVNGIPERNENKARSYQVKYFLQPVGESNAKVQPLVTRRYRLWSDTSLGPGTLISTHLNEDCLNNLRALIKKIRYQCYDKELVTAACPCPALRLDKLHAALIRCLVLWTVTKQFLVSCFQGL